MRPRARRVRVTSKSLFYAIIIHVAAAVLLVINIDWPTHVASPRSEPAPVQASVVSEAEIQKQMNAIQEKEQAEGRRQQEAQEKLEELLKQKQAEEQRLAEIKQRQEQEQQEAEELARQKEQEQQELAKLKQQEEEQRQQEQAEAERKRQEEAEAERKRQEEAEAERKRQEEAEAERRRQEEAERKRQEEEERRRREAEEQRQKELAEERERERALQEQLEQERVASQFQSALDRYVPIIRQKVGRNWNRPAGLRDSIEAHVNVRLSQAGEVLSARITKSSGNPVFDRSVENAVLKASPLPIPQEQGVNDRFRNMNLRFRPEDMTS